MSRASGIVLPNATEAKWDTFCHLTTFSTCLVSQYLQIKFFWFFFLDWHSFRSINFRWDLTEGRNTFWLREVPLTLGDFWLAFVLASWNLCIALRMDRLVLMAQRRQEEWEFCHWFWQGQGSMRSEPSRELCELYDTDRLTVQRPF